MKNTTDRKTERHDPQEELEAEPGFICKVDMKGKERDKTPSWVPSNEFEEAAWRKPTRQEILWLGGVLAAVAAVLLLFALAP